MNTTISDFKKFIHNRFSGNVNELIEGTKKQIELINRISSENNDFWLLWYKDYLKEYEKYCKAIRFLPGRFCAKKIESIYKQMDHLIRRCAKNDRLLLKKISLPLPQNANDNSQFCAEISDILLQYLLESKSKQLLDSGFSYGQEGPYEYKAVRIEKGDIVIDAGANIGVFSALASVKDCKNVYAFEPSPYTINTYLRKTAEWNPNISICEYALSDKAGEVSFHQVLNHIGASSFVIKSQNSNQVKVKAIDMDAFVEKNKLESVDFIKADIEGAERYMLMGAKAVMKEFAPKIAICTYHLADDPKVLRELILEANPKYVIEEKWKKIYAYVPMN